MANKTLIKVGETDKEIDIGTNNTLNLIGVRQVLTSYGNKGKDLIANPDAEKALHALLIIESDVKRLLKLAKEKLLADGLAEKGDKFDGAKGKSVEINYLAKSGFVADEIEAVPDEFVRQSLNVAAIKKYVNEHGKPPGGVIFAEKPKTLQLKLL